MLAQGKRWAVPWWNANPLPLEDMLSDHYTRAHFTVATGIEHLRMRLRDPSPVSMERARKLLEAVASNLHLTELESSAGFADGLIERIDRGVAAKATLAGSLHDLAMQYERELRSRQVYVLDAQSVRLIEESDHLPDAVVYAFPGVDFEIGQAARCCAYDLAAASVMHSMRALERPLKELAAI